MLKRYTTDELKEIASNLLIEQLATSNKIYLEGKVRLEGNSIPYILYNERNKLVSAITSRINDFKKRKAESDEEDAKVFQQGIELLQEEYKRLTSCNTIEQQKKRFEETKDAYATHTYLEVPLNKKLNALYDSFSIQALLYDELSTSLENINKLQSLTSLEEKMNFVKGLIEITHMSLQSGKCLIAIQGKYNKGYTDIKSPSCSILPSNYSDFAKVTLADCEKIRNNDLKQIIQERIDMDKENLELLTTLDVRGDNYKIYKKNDNLYIRYVCPSTGRVYYNLLSLNYLERSKYFDKKDINSYILAWYSINNLFMELDEEVLSNNAIRC